MQRAGTSDADAEAMRVRGEVELGGLETGSSRLGGTILELQGVSLDLGGRRLIDDLTLRLVKGNRIGIVGPNGAGKTTLLRLITGELPTAQGTIVRGVKTGANVLLLDEPTNDLDLATLGSLAELIESWPGCVLVVSHDRSFLDSVVTSVLAFEGEGSVQLYAGNWSSYREQKAGQVKRARRTSKGEGRRLLQT